MAVDLWVAGIPVQQGSMIPGRPVRGKNGAMRSTMHSHNPEELKAWRSTIAQAIRDARHPQIGPYVAVRMSFFMPKPASTKYPEYPAGTPDLDKLYRAVGDALTESGLIEDDARIVRATVEEEWAVTHGPGLRLSVYPR